MSNQSKSINQKFDEQIDAYLDRLKEEMNPENESDLNDELTRTSEVTRDTLDGDGNVTSSVVERHDEMTNHNLESLKSLVAIKNDYNDHRKSRNRRESRSLARWNRHPAGIRSKSHHQFEKPRVSAQAEDLTCNL